MDAPGGTDLRDGRVWMYGGHGAQLAPLVHKMENDFGAGFPVWTESLAWEARSSSDNYYDAQVNDGVRMMKDEILSIVNGCSVIPKILLAGHSGGADVVMRTLDYFSGGGYSTFIDAAVVYGDPSTTSSQNWNAPGVSGSNGIFSRPASRTDAIMSSYRYFGWSIDSSSNPTPGYHPRVRAYCNEGDWACRGPITGAWSNEAHNSYTSNTQNVFTWYMSLTDSYD